MKKIFALLTILTFSTPLAFEVVSCNKNQNYIDLNNPLLINTSIDKSNQSDSSGNYIYKEKPISNFFVIGDSLSDIDGVTTLAEQKFQKQLGLNLDIKLTGAYGFEDEDSGEQHSAFTNGLTAAGYLAKEIGMPTFNATNQYSVADSEGKYGKNYAIGGATALKIDTAPGILLNDANVEIQAKTLISQQVIHDNDLVFFEIGGNDLFNIIDGDWDNQEEKINDSINTIRRTFFTLLNNGVKKIIFMTPPQMTFPPEYSEKAKDEYEKDKIVNICEEFYEKVMSVLTEVGNYYKNNVKLYDLYQETGENYLKIEDGLVNEWLDTITDPNDKATAKDHLENKEKYTDGSNYNIVINVDGEVTNIDVEADTIDKIVEKVVDLVVDNPDIEKNKVTIEIKAMPNSNENDKNDVNHDLYFFNDFVHPTTKAHELVAKKLLNIFSSWNEGDK